MSKQEITLEEIIQGLQNLLENWKKQKGRAWYAKKKPVGEFPPEFFKGFAEGMRVASLDLEKFMEIFYIQEEEVEIESQDDPPSESIIYINVDEAYVTKLLKRATIHPSELFISHTDNVFTAMFSGVRLTPIDSILDQMEQMVNLEILDHGRTESGEWFIDFAFTAYPS